MSRDNMSTPAQNNLTVADALQALPTDYRTRLIKAYSGLKDAFGNGNYDACGLRAGRFCEVLLRWVQVELTGTSTAFGAKIQNFRDECEKCEQTPASAGHESVRVLIPRALNFLYTLRNKRGIGHEGGDVDANEIDAATAVRIADWCVSELIRLKHTVSLEEAQAICDAVAERQMPQIWEVGGKKRVLKPSLNYTDQTLLLLYSTAEIVVGAEDLLDWTEHSNPAVYRRDVLRRLHKARYVEYDEEAEMVRLSPTGIRRVENELLD